MQPSVAQAAMRNSTYKKIRISEVNTEARYVEGVDGIGSPFRVEWNSHPVIAYAPVVGEDWIISRVENIWKLMWRYDYEKDKLWAPGDARIDAARLHLDAEVFVQGQRLPVKETQYNEIPTGLIDGSNKLFVTNRAFLTGTLRVYHNGLRITSFLEVSGVALELLAAPAPGDTLIVDYDYDPRAFKTIFEPSTIVGGR